MPDIEQAGHWPVVVVESRLIGSVRRVPHGLPTRIDMPKSWQDSHPFSEVAHPAGGGSGGLGFSSPSGLGRGPGNMGLKIRGDAVNQLIENQGIEGFLRRLRSKRMPEMQFRMVTETRLRPLSLDLSARRYTVFAEHRGTSKEFFSLRLNIGESRGSSNFKIKEIGDGIYFDDLSLGGKPFDDISMTRESWITDLLEELELPVASKTPLHDAQGQLIRALFGE